MHHSTHMHYSHDFGPFQNSAQLIVPETAMAGQTTDPWPSRLPTFGRLDHQPLVGLITLPGNRGLVWPPLVWSPCSGQLDRFPFPKNTHLCSFLVNLYLVSRPVYIFIGTWCKYTPKHSHTNVWCQFPQRLHRRFDRRPWPVRPPSHSRSDSPPYGRSDRRKQTNQHFAKLKVHSPNSSTMMPIIHHLD